MFQTTNHIHLNPPRVEGTRFRFRWWLQILNRFFPKANLKILGHTHMLEKIPKSAGSGWGEKTKKTLQLKILLVGHPLFLRSLEQLFSSELEGWLGGALLNGVATIVLVC